MTLNKAIWLTIILLLTFFFPDKNYSQGVTAPGGSGAWGNMFYGGIVYSHFQPYSKATDLTTTFGIGLGDPYNAVGFQIGSSMLETGALERFNMGLKVHHFVDKGISAAIGAENMVTFGTEGTRYDLPVSLYFAFTQYVRDYVPKECFLSRISYCLGAGVGRFSKLNLLDEKQHGRTKGTTVFGGVSYMYSNNLSFSIDWSGTNMNVGVFATTYVAKIPINFSLAILDLTPYSGDRLRFVAGVCCIYQFPGKPEESEELLIKKMLQNQEKEILNNLIRRAQDNQ